MQKAVELCQLVACSVNHTTWNIPRIRDRNRWRNITNSHLVENPTHVNGYDHFENANFRAKQIMEECGWETEITDTEGKKDNWSGR